MDDIQAIFNKTLKATRCEWSLDTVDGSDCGKPVNGHSAYCTEHFNRAYVTVDADVFEKETESNLDAMDNADNDEDDDFVYYLNI